MKIHTLSYLIAGLLLSLVPVGAQTRGAPQFQITKISPSIVKTPEFQISGSTKPGQKALEWLEVEVEFRTEPELTEELSFNYYILFAGKLLKGDVTHVNVVKGRDHRSVMYVAPNTLSRFLDGKSLTASSVENIGVEMLRQGQVLSMLSLKDARGPWWQSLPQLTGFVLSKNETPFAPLYWDRYEAIKAQSR